jgi:hypothetical protein
MKVCESCSAQEARSPVESSWAGQHQSEEVSPILWYVEVRAPGPGTKHLAQSLIASAFFLKKSNFGWGN